MRYDDERRKIVDYVTENGNIIELTKNRDNVKSYYQELESYTNTKKLAIRYPGYKTTSKKSDYCVYWVDEEGEHPVSHVEVMCELYNKTTIDNFVHMKRYIEDVAVNGKNIRNYRSLDSSFRCGCYSFEVLTDLMVYIAVQEDINYPMPRYLGRKMSFFRYLEAIYCKTHCNHSLEEAIEKATRRGGRPASNWNDVGDLYDIVSQIRY